MEKLGKDINLLSGGKFEESPVGKFFKWALTVGRYIVIFTELIVIVSFISRFKLDADLNELNKDIKEKQAAIISFGDLEKNVGFLQSRLEIIKSREKSGIRADKVLEECSSIIPVDVVLSDLSIEESSVSLEGAALSHQGLAAFIEGFKASDLFDEIDLRKVSSKGEGQEIEFEIAVKLTGGGDNSPPPS